MTHTWTTVPKPTSTSSTISFTGGVPIGLLLALTTSQSSVTAGGDNWTRIVKASGQVWTTVPKAT